MNGGSYAEIERWIMPVKPDEVPPLSTLYDFNKSDEGFRLENDQSHSQVQWDQANGRVRVHVDRRDNGVEFFNRLLPLRLTPLTSFKITSEWHATQQGNHHAAAPLVLAGKDLKLDDFLTNQPNVICVMYYSYDSNLRTKPGYVMHFRDVNSDERLPSNQFNGTQDTTYKFAIEYDAVSRMLTLSIVGQNFSHDVKLEPSTEFDFDLLRIGVASGLSSDRWAEPTIEAWVDDIRVENFKVAKVAT